jgi:hypothetical protein
MGLFQIAKPFLDFDIFLFANPEPGMLKAGR